MQARHARHVWDRYNMYQRPRPRFAGPHTRWHGTSSSKVGTRLRTIEDRIMFRHLKMCYKKKRRLINVMKTKGTAGATAMTTAL